MNALSVIILAAVAALAAAAVRYIIKHHTCSGCGGQCSGNCSGCQGCSAYGKSEDRNRKKGQP